MPVKWTLDMECEMLLIAVSNLKPAASTWQAVADRLGHGLNANTVRYYTSDCVSIISYFSLFCLACPLSPGSGARLDSFMFSKRLTQPPSSQKFYKLKREAENRADGNSTSATPSITTSKAAKTPKSTGGRKRKINLGTEETLGKRIKAAQAKAGEEEEDGGIKQYGGESGDGGKWAEGGEHN